MGDESGIVVRCVCGVGHTLEQWAQLDFVGVQDDGVDTLIELRNCVCGSTRARRCDLDGVIRLLNETARRLRRALGRLREIEKATAGLSQSIVEIDRGAVKVADDVERARAVRIVRETLSSLHLPDQSETRREWLKTLSEILEARIAKG